MMALKINIKVANSKSNCKVMKMLATHQTMNTAKMKMNFSMIRRLHRILVWV